MMEKLMKMEKKKLTEMIMRKMKSLVRKSRKVRKKKRLKRKRKRPHESHSPLSKAKANTFPN